jgi:hypothetical protein
MTKDEFIPSRRQFLEKLAVGSTTLLAATAIPLAISAKQQTTSTDGADWVKKIKGKHKIVLDGPEIHDGYPVIWAWVFLKTNNETGIPDDDMTAAVVLRHNAVCLALNDTLWAKYRLGEFFKVTDPLTDAPSNRNLYWAPNHFPFKDFGIDGIEKLQNRGALFAVCEMAISVYSALVAKWLGLNAEEVRKDWISGVLPGVSRVPSGVWAVGRAQEKGCAYCYAGG